jgi:hypothetical protein
MQGRWLMKIIPNYPEVPDLTSEQLKKITEIVFLSEIKPCPCDAIFVFGCPDTKIWSITYEAYKDGFGKHIIVTGGYNPNIKLPQSEWNYGTTPESQVIVSKLKSMGVPEDVIFYEDKSVNSWENVIFAKEIYNFGRIESILVICKNVAVGRQSRILKKFIPYIKKLIPYTYETILDSDSPPVTRHNWMKHEKSLSFVFGSYLKIVQASLNNGIGSLESYVEGLDEYIGKYC